MKHPATTECATCGGVAERIAYVLTGSWTYDCQGCHAGGEITADGDRRGGVFEKLENQSTRDLDADARVVDGHPVATDGGTSEPDVYPDGETLPESHPLAAYHGALDTHADHLDALGEYLVDADADHVHGAMLVTTTDDGTDTIPTMREDADFDACVWYQLAAHISHVANAFDAAPDEVARHACHVLDDLHGEDGGESA